MAIAVTITVVAVAGVYLADGFNRRETAAGRTWALAFLALGVSPLGSLGEHWLHGVGWAPAALGQLCFISFFAALCVGLRLFNHHRIALPLVLGGLFAMVGGVGVAVADATGIPVIRDVAILSGVAVLAACAAVEAFRGRLAGRRTTLLGIALVAVGLFGAISLIIQLIPVLQSSPLGTVFSESNGALITLPLAVVAVTTTIVLQAESPRPARGDGELRLSADGFLDPPSFELVLEMLIARAERAGDQVAVLAMVALDLSAVGEAVGESALARLRGVWRVSWVTRAPISAIHGDLGDDCLAVILQPSTIGEANRIGNRLYGGTVDDLAALDDAILPGTGIGVAMSDGVGAAEMLRRAQAAARSTAQRDRGSPDDWSVDEVLERALAPRRQDEVRR